jgi:hypothetical protein
MSSPLEQIRSVPPPPSGTEDLLSWLLQAGWVFVVAGAYGAVSRTFTDMTIIYFAVTGIALFALSAYMRVAIYKQKTLFQISKLQMMKDMMKDIEPPRP